MFDLEKYLTQLKDEQMKKLEELNGFNQLSPEQKERIFELKNLAEMLKTAKPSN